MNINNKCNLCGETKLKKRPGKVRDNDSLEVLECTNCGLVFLSSFDHIKENFYEESGMHNDGNDSTLQDWIKETAFDDERRFKKYSELINGKDILDFGCGNGGFLIRAKNKANKVFGIELEKSVQEYFKQNGLTVFSDIDEMEEKDAKVDYIFMFHVLEHIENPIPLLEKFKKILKPNGKLIVEVPNSDDALLTLYENKAFSEFTYWSPHLYLYNEKTLENLLSKAHFETEKIEQEQRYTLANHLYWLAKGLPGGHAKWDFIDSVELNMEYEKSLAKIRKCDTVVGFFQDKN